MSSRHAQKLAQHLLDEHCDERVFEVGTDPADLDEVANALRALGCNVAEVHGKPILVVTCPDDYRRTG